MTVLAEPAELVKNALQKSGLETPMLSNPFSREEKKRRLSTTCEKFCLCLNWI